MAEPAKYIQPTAYDAEGNPVAPEVAPQLVAEGKAGYQKGARVWVRNETGQLGTVDASEAAAQPVLSQGQLEQLLLKRDAESASGLAKTAGEGVVRGATLGFAGPEQFYDAEGRAAAKARQQYNPNLSAGSELAGAVGGTIAAGLLTGGAGAAPAAEMTGGRLAAMAARGALTPFRAAAALGEGAEAVATGLGAGKGILGAGLRMGARGLAEGAVMGAGHAVSEAALEDVPLTAERLLAGAWDGAKVGGAFGLGLGVVGAGVGKAGRAIMGRISESGDDLAKATGSWAENATFKQHVGNNGKIYDQATNFGQDMARPARIGRKLLDADMPVAPRQALRRAEELTRDAGQRMEGVVKAVDDAGITADAGAVIATVDDQIAKIREVPFGDAQAVADRIERNLAPFRERYAQKIDELNKLGLENFNYGRDGMRDMGGIRAAYAGATRAEARAIALGERAPMGSVTGRPLDPVRIHIEPGEPPILNDGRHRMFAAKEAGADSVMAKVVRYDAKGNAISTELRPVSIAPFDAAAGQQIKLSELWGLRKELDKSISFETAQRGPAKEALMDVRNAFRSELDATVARAAESAQGDPGLLKAWKQAAEDYGDMALIKKSLKQLTNRQAKNRALSLTDNMNGGAAGLLMGILSGSPVTGMATSAVAGGVHKLIRERGLGVMAKIADRAGGVAGNMETAAKVAAMVEAPKRVALPVAVNVTKQFERYSAALNEANAEPAKFVEKMAAATADVALRTPELAQQIQKTMLGDLAYLNQIHPQPASRKNNTLTPLAIKPEFYAFNQQKAFVDAAVALDNPLSVFESIAHGELPLTGLAAIKARRPALFGEMRQTVVKYTMTRQEELPFSRRMLLGTAFEFPADWSMLNVAAIQASLATPEKKPNDPTAAPSKVNKDPGSDIAPGGF